MSRTVLVLLLVCWFAVFSEGCGTARKARKVRKLEAARRADNAAAAKRSTDSLSTRADTVRAASPSLDTVEIAALDPSRTSASPLLLTLHGRSIPFRTFSGKARVRYESGDKFYEFTATLRIRQDSAVWISVVAVGGLVPVARVLITQDSFFLINYLHREARVMPVSAVSAMLPLPAKFSQLQNLILGTALEPAAPITATGGMEGSDEVHFVSTRSEEMAYTAYYDLRDSTLYTQESRSLDGTTETTILYSDYNRENGRLFSLKRDANVRIRTSDAEELHKMDMQFTDQPRFDAPLEFSFSIPKNYTLK